MKTSRLFLLLMACLWMLPQGGMAQTERVEPKIKFEQILGDVGRLSAGKGEKRTVTFEFTNVGTGELIFSKAETSCGCTTVKLPKKAVKPGKKGKLQVTVDASHMDDRGVFGNLITLYYNASQRYTRIRVKGEMTD